MDSPRVPVGIELWVGAVVEGRPDQWGWMDHRVASDPAFWLDLLKALRVRSGDDMIVCRRQAGRVGDDETLGDEVLSIGGDDEGVCVDHGTLVAEGRVHHMVVQPERGDDPEFHQGRSFEMPARKWVSKDLATRALHYFIENGGRDPELEWEYDSLWPRRARAARDGSPLPGSAEIQPDAIAAWQEAARDLGIHVVTPYEITDPATGEEISCFVYLRDFGSEGGMAVVPMRDLRSERITSLARSLGLYTSLMGEQGWTYERDRFIATLNDWGWHGDPAHKPSWYTGEPWS